MSHMEAHLVLTGNHIILNERGILHFCQKVLYFNLDGKLIYFELLWHM